MWNSYLPVVIVVVVVFFWGGGGGRGEVVSMEVNFKFHLLQSEPPSEDTTTQAPSKYEFFCLVKQQRPAFDF